MFIGKPGFRVRVPKEEIPGLYFWKPEETPGLHLWRPQEETEGWRPESWMAPEADPSQGPFDNLDFRFGGGLLGATEESTWPPASSRPSLPDVEPVAAGDLRCQGVCSQGGDRGMTGSYRQGGDVLCAKCIVKRLGYENVPSSELPKLLAPWSLDRK